MFNRSKKEIAVLPAHESCTVAVIGLGYVGLPLAVEFGKKQVCLRTNKKLNRRVIGFDINKQRLADLSSGLDKTNETTKDQLEEASLLEFTSKKSTLKAADVYIVTVPTPIDSSKKPNLEPLMEASKTVGEAIKLKVNNKTDVIPVIIYESTVFPGATEEICVPIIEKESGLKINEGFVCGYSPERINPGDKDHRVTSILKVTSGSNQEALDWIDELYGSIIKAGTYRASNIKVAEAAKVIENTQRDLNIALVNELAMIFRILGIDTNDVIETAATKWNFIPFKPGLVGGHCISVDPYYLTYKSEQVGYHPQIVLAGRRINDGMSSWIVEQLVLEMATRKMIIGGAKVLVLGLAFKENCPDLRNTRVVNMITSLIKYGMTPTIVDPWVDSKEAYKSYGLDVYATPKKIQYQAIIIAVAHNQFCSINSNEWKELLDSNGILLDLKGIAPRDINVMRI